LQGLPGFDGLAETIPANVLIADKGYDKAMTRTSG
jgi:hypothetical protein